MAAISRIPKRIAVSTPRTSASCFQILLTSYSEVLPHGAAQTAQSGATVFFSSLTFSIIAFKAATPMLLFVIVCTRPSMMISSVFSVFGLLPQDLARPIRAPVSSSWSAKISCPCKIVAVLLIFSFLIPSFFVWISIRFLDFHFCCNNNIIPIYLFQSGLSFHKTRNHNAGPLILGYHQIIIPFR